MGRGRSIVTDPPLSASHNDVATQELVKRIVTDPPLSASHNELALSATFWSGAW